MPFTFCSVSSWNSTFSDHIYMVYTLGGLLVINCFLSNSTTRLMKLITMIWSRF